MNKANLKQNVHVVIGRKAIIIAIEHKGSVKFSLSEAVCKKASNPVIQFNVALRPYSCKLH